MEDPENLQRRTSWLINDEVRENPVEKDVPVREIAATVATVRGVSQFVKALEEFAGNPVRCDQALLLQQIKPDRIDIEDGIFSELKGIQSQPKFFARCASLNVASFRRASSGP